MAIQAVLQKSTLSPYALNLKFGLKFQPKLNLNLRLGLNLRSSLPSLIIFSLPQSSRVFKLLGLVGTNILLSAPVGAILLFADDTLNSLLWDV
ncbi:hypothetical protein CFIMG_007496RA00001 [Ceratocystis fimbriata CBS 114723]|uniref:Uncharacterized protein n=1 Tax=Ceratocystis fimbriata CBS 114723 TaxID=1035309 RepID=A0A2C5WX06_9PEZI|nr:hypothetical protein CFIMG_007496RA00001 [Ceratocystis fimbriata CBS 114723]